MVKYSLVDEIVNVNEFRINIKKRFHEQARKNRTKFLTYLQIHPAVSPSPFLRIIHPVAGEIIKVRVESHYIAIETGRWVILERSERLCDTSRVVRDERHIIFDCSLIKRNDLFLKDGLDNILNQPDILKPFSRIS